MGVRLHAASVPGPAHLQAGLPNQDAVLIRRGRWGWLAAVSDGMGSRTHARAGARAACRAARQSVRQVPFEAEDRAWVETLYRDWLAQLAKEHIRPADAAATCLLARGLPDGRFRLAQLGDGLILGHPQPVRGLAKREADAFGNETLGLGVSRRFADWHFARGALTEPGHGLALMTDGIADDLGDTDGLIESLVVDLRRRGARAARVALTRDLNDWPTRHHSDDKTIAVVYRAGGRISNE
ncbi:protein phosphatase 2C domain-containing protein [uncultured Thiohalocapsa sp.]|uniref:protein phosphatase 2C domain-containing protein n=1 Tax=uncultured Thiohalocapsa sp. TaxID=768990 RepID=UPI0025E1860B|nr:protein phosphatase 2C domain-containing protein [uncultured Thiohalocapsa sp.]